VALPRRAAAGQADAVLLLTRLRRHGWLLLALLLVVFTVFFAFAAAGSKSSAARSARLHRDGIRVVGTVAAVANHRSSHGTDARHSQYTSDVTVSLPSPVQGHATTRLHFSHTARLIVGQPVTVLVDPRNPGYAEQPGQGTSGSQWKVLTGVAIGTGVLAVAVGVVAVRQRRSDAG
jgi:hypothetical protein